MIARRRWVRSSKWLALGLGALFAWGCVADERRRRHRRDDGSTSVGAGGAGGSSVGGSSSGGGGGGTTTTVSSTSSGANPCEGGPLPGPIAGCAPAPLPSTGDFGQDCVDRINQLRWECQCLPPLQRWTQQEICSDTQSAADQQSNGAHGNFGQCGENGQNTCPNWGSEADVIGGCLQMMWNEGPGQPFSEHGHYLNMSSTKYSKVACGRASSGSGVWSNQNFAP